MPSPPALIAIPTMGRPGYLDTALASVKEQAAAAGVPVLVIDDAPGGNAETRATAARHGAEYLLAGPPGGLNAARNLAFAARPQVETTPGRRGGSGPGHGPSADAPAAPADALVLFEDFRPGAAPLVLFLDDDVRADPGWLDAMLAAQATATPDVAALAGRLIPWLDPATAPRSCGRHGAHVTALDLGDQDQDVAHGWGANLGIRRDWLDRVGPFDATHGGGGDEEEWLDRAAADGARVRYIAAASVLHERHGPDARLRSLARGARARGREAVRFEAAHGRNPGLVAELRTLAGCVGHVFIHRCPMGWVLAAHSLGRVEQTLAPAPAPARPGLDDFLSGRSGHVAGKRADLLRAADRALDLVRAPLTALEQLRARRLPRRRVLVLTIARDPAAFAPTAARLTAGRHHVTVDVQPIDARGKFERISAMLAAHDLTAYDHVLLVDDDVELPRGFTDRLLWAVERAGLQLAQPAHRRHSHAAWPVTTRRLNPHAARLTHFVEIGPVTLLRGEALGALVPFPDDLTMGWGLDVHWSAVARDAGWPIGVVDSTPLLHTAPVGAGYGREAVLDAARAFLADRPYVTREEAAWSAPAPVVRTGSGGGR